MEGISHDFGNSVDAWVAMIMFVEEQRKNKSSAHANGDGGDGAVTGFLGEVDDNNGANNDDLHPRMKARLKYLVKKCRPGEECDQALTLLLDSLEVLPTSHQGCTSWVRVSCACASAAQRTASMRMWIAKWERTTRSTHRISLMCTKMPGGNESSCRLAVGVVREGQEEGRFIDIPDFGPSRLPPGH